MLVRSPELRGCDTFVAYPPATPAGTVIFGKNSDRPVGEAQSVRRYPGTAGCSGDLTCTYIKIPRTEWTSEVLLSQIDWMWGAEMGANAHGVVIGNEAVWTREPMESEALLGMDLVRLGLERGRSSREALDVVTNLLEEHGQGGACAEDDPSFAYHNSFLIADFEEAWVLESAGRHWAAQRVASGCRNISNGLTIRTRFDLASKGLQEHAKTRGYWDGTTPFDFSRCFSDGPLTEEDPESRQVCGAKLMQKYGQDGAFDADAMMQILRHRESGICMQGGGFETTASMVTDLRENNAETRHWMTGRPHPCDHDFVLQESF